MGSPPASPFPYLFPTLCSSHVQEAWAAHHHLSVIIHSLKMLLHDRSCTSKNVKSRFMHKATCVWTNDSCWAQFPALISSLAKNTMLLSHRTEQLGEKSWPVPRQQRAYQMPKRWGWTVGQQNIHCQGSKQHDGYDPKVRIFAWSYAERLRVNQVKHFGWDLAPPCAFGCSRMPVYWNINIGDTDKGIYVVRY